MAISPWFALLVALLAGGTVAAPIRFQVAADGSDDGPGTEARPFASLERARDAIRAVKQAAPLPAGGAEVIVHAGVYARATTFALTAEDSGAPGAPIVYRAAPGAEVRLTGGRSIPAEAFRPVTEPAVLSRLDEAAHGQVVVTDLRAAGLTEFGQIPDKYRGVPATPELFYNDRRQTLARWPNEGWATIARIVEQGSVPRNNDNSNRPGSFEYAGDRPARWNAAAGVWLLGYWCFDWYEEVIRVGQIDPATKTITLAAPHLYGVRQGNPSPRRWRALNLLEELDSPGEYYLDRATGRLYFWPPEPLAGARISLSTLTGPVLSLSGCQHVTVRGFIVEAGLGDGLQVADGADCRIQACTVRNFRQRGIVVTGGTSHRVEGCDVADTGSGGIHLTGGDRTTLTPAGHVAHNNHIRRFSMHQLTYANGLTLAGVGHRATHNLIHDAPHQAVSLSGNDHLFEFNIVHHVCLETDDCGALYKGRNPSMRGNVIRHNFWHNIGGPMGHGNAAIYFDDGDGGETVVGNVFFRCGDPGKGNFGTIFSHGGHDNTAENNVFIECRRAIGSSPWNDKRWADYIKADLWQERLRREVDITSRIYLERYPALAGFLDPQPGAERINRARTNVFALCGQVSSGNWKWTEEENLITAEDPGFVNAAAGDFTLKPDSVVFTRLPGFQPIPFERMGLVADELRPNPIREPWPYDPPRQAAPPEKR